jgi:hypothetical protein
MFASKYYPPGSLNDPRRGERGTSHEIPREGDVFWTDIVAFHSVIYVYYIMASQEPLYMCSNNAEGGEKGSC